MGGTIPSGLAHVEATHTPIQAQRNMHATFLTFGKQEPEFHVLGTPYPSVLDWYSWCIVNDSSQSYYPVDRKCGMTRMLARFRMRAW